MSYFLSVCIGFLAGICLSAFVLSDTSLFFCLGLFVLIFFYTLFFEKGSVRTAGFIISLLFLGVFLGQFRVLGFDHFVSHGLEKFESPISVQGSGVPKQKVTLIGKIISQSVGNGDTQKFTFAATGVVHASSTIPVEGNVLVTTELFPQFHYGDIVSISGTLEAPQMVAESDGRMFNYPAYLFKDGITENISFGYVKYLGKNEGNILVKFLYGIEEKFVTSIQSVLPEPESGLLAGIVLGTQTLSKNLSNNFRVAGLSHIVVLSGYNITIVADSVLAVALFFAPAYASFIAVFSVALFVLMSGAGASALRAGIMAAVALLGKRFGKTYDSGRALFFAAFVMILWNPMTLLYDPSFHLSFLATVSMIYFSPWMFEKLTKIPEKYGLRETLSTTLAVNIFVLPYILYMSGSVQIFSLPANMLVLPFVSITMFLGFFTALFGFVSRYLGLIFGLPSYVILFYDIFIAQTISSLPFAQVSIPHFSLPIMIGIYILFSYFLYKKNRPTPQVVTSDGYTVI